MFDREEYINQPLTLEKELNILFNRQDQLNIFEIGACEGEDSIKYAKFFPNSTIYSFEPLPKNIEFVKRNILKYKAENVKLFPFALSEVVGEAEFHVSSSDMKDNNDWDYGNKSSSLMKPKEHLELANFIDFKEVIKIKTSTIKEFAKEKNIKIVDYIHLDVQGAELLVLKGAEQFLSNIKVIWMEVSKKELYSQQPLYSQVVEFMIANNFYLIKDTVDEVTGDQLYINKKFYSDFLSIKKKIDKVNSIVSGGVKSKIKNFLRNLIS